jgi:hypothetical protein
MLETWPRPLRGYPAAKEITTLSRLGAFMGMY